MARGGRARRTPFSTYRIRKRPRDDRSGALSISGGDDGIRTHDPHVANVMLSQLSYIPRNRQDSILALGCVVVNGYVARNRKSITPQGCGATVRVDGRTGLPATPCIAGMSHRTRLPPFGICAPGSENHARTTVSAPAFRRCRKGSEHRRHGILSRKAYEFASASSQGRLVVPYVFHLVVLKKPIRFAGVFARVSGMFFSDGEISHGIRSAQCYNGHDPSPRFAWHARHVPL